MRRGLRPEIGRQARRPAPRASALPRRERGTRAVVGPPLAYARGSVRGCPVERGVRRGRSETCPTSGERLRNARDEKGIESPWGGPPGLPVLPGGAASATAMRLRIGRRKRPMPLKQANDPSCIYCGAGTLESTGEAPCFHRNHCPAAGPRNNPACSSLSDGFF